MAENTQTNTARPQRTSRIESKQAELAKRFAANRKPQQENRRQEDKTAAARRAADTARRDGGRSL